VLQNDKYFLIGVEKIEEGISREIQGGGRYSELVEDAGGHATGRA
jgi:hypothetical protein